MNTPSNTTHHAVNYISEPTINSELLLFNNSKKLEKNRALFCDKHLDEIIKLRAEYEKLDQDDSSGLQKTKRDIRNRIRDLSFKTYVDRDSNIFGGMIVIIMDKILTRPNFSGYSYKDEMKSLATEHILKYTYKFDTYRQSKISGQYISAFTYISTIVFNAFVATINKQNEEYKKAKTEFMETQKLIHRDTNNSTYNPDEENQTFKIVNLNHLKGRLIDEIKKIVFDTDNIDIIYPDTYTIDMNEYDEIMKYNSKFHTNLCIYRPRLEEDDVK